MPGPFTINRRVRRFIGASIQPILNQPERGNFQHFVKLAIQLKIAALRMVLNLSPLDAAMAFRLR